MVRILKFDNGNFVSVTEGMNKLGPMMISLGTGPIPVTTTVIPAKSESIFLKLIAERLSTTMKGICIVTASVNELDSDSVKTLIVEIVELSRNV